MTSTAAPTFQSMIDEAGPGSTIVLKKGIYNIDGTLKINKALTIRAEDGCPHEVSNHTLLELILETAMIDDVFFQDVVLCGTAPVDKKGVLREITGKVSHVSAFVSPT